MLFNSTQDHEVFAKHDKFGTFPVPQNFLNWNGPPDQHNTLDTSALDLKKLSDVNGKDAADKAAEEAAKEKMKKVAARKARQERAKIQQAAAAMTAMEEVKAAAAVEEAEVKAAAEIAMEHADPTKASKVESAVQIRPGSASDSALGLLGWRRDHSSSLGDCPQWSGHCLISRRCDPLCIREGCSGFAETTPAAVSDLITTRRGTAP